jgi:hypothetical protein
MCVEQLVATGPLILPMGYGVDGYGIRVHSCNLAFSVSVSARAFTSGLHLALIQLQKHLENLPVAPRPLAGRLENRFRHAPLEFVEY